MSEIVERVALAIEAAYSDNKVIHAADNWFVPLARAAITAMREPTKPMLEAAHGRLNEYASHHYHTRVWQTMIDEALR